MIYFYFFNIYLYVILNFDRFGFVDVNFLEVNF